MSADYKFYQTPLHLNKQDDLIKVVQKPVNKYNFPCKIYKTLAEYINELRNGAKFTKEKASEIYNEYMNNIKYSYERMKGKYGRLYKSVEQKEFKLFEEEKVTFNNNSEQIDAFVEEFLKSLSAIAANQDRLWGIIIDFIKVFSDKLIPLLIPEYTSLQNDKLREYIFSTKVNSSELGTFQQIKSIEEYGKIAIIKREQLKKSYAPMSIENYKLIERLSSLPIIFEETYFKNTPEVEIPLKPLSKPKHAADHLFVFVHGYQGNPGDLRQVKSYISINFSGYKFLCSSKNESETKGNILDMGKNLAMEVKEFIRDEYSKDIPSKISFIGHSLGGLIIRAALPFLQEYKSVFNTFMTLSSPHLGLMYNSNSLVSTGVWFMKTFSSSLCIQQLSMNDSTAIENTVLYRLSMYDGLECFKHVALVSSNKDSFVPFESARIELNEKAFTDSARGAAYIKMANSILSKVNDSALVKIVVDFKIEQKSLNKVIGMAAHIEFLEDSFWIRMILSKRPDLFE